MSHYTEEDLVLYHYGERDDREEIGAHLESCAACRTIYGGLERLFDAVSEKPIPERSAAYPAEVWHRLEAELERKATSGWRGWFSWPRLALAASVAVLVVVAFVTGLDRGRDAVYEELSAEVREKVLMLAVGQHLEQSQRMLVTLVNSRPGGGVDLSNQRDQARRLASHNRVYRATAGQAGHAGMVELLEQLERVLTEIANSPDSLTAAEYVELWSRIEGSALLVKMRILENETRQRTRPPRDLANEI